MKPLPKQSEVLANKSPYGDPRGVPVTRASSAWQSQNLTRMTPAFQLYYAGVALKTITVHKYCKEHFEHFFETIRAAAEGNKNTLKHWGIDLYAGSFNYRLMRNSSSVLSMHSYGCAMDFDPARNGLGDKTPRFAQFPQLVKAFRASKLVWGADWDGDGQTADTRTWDGMHFQATQPLR